MDSSEKMDYTAAGLKAGIEIHQQLKTKRKLFCRCPAELTTRNPDFTITRYFRPVLGEMGVFDEAMLLEFKKKNQVVYEGFTDINCTYELDDTPPFECDDEAITITLELAKLLDMTIIDEFKVCRKNYLDGSVPGGFQRTIIAAKDGKYELANGKSIGIEILCLEEDSARRVSQEPGKITFRLDRLGVPLVEIATAPDIKSPEEAKEAAARLGLLLRSTGKVRRGLGVTRQDLNVSIKDGARIEIKGVQKLDWIPLLVHNEAVRQFNLVKIKAGMAERKVTAEYLKGIEPKGVDVSKDFANTGVKFIKNGIKNGQKLVAMIVPRMAGLLGMELQPDRRFGTELSDRVKVLVGLSGIIHSDEKLDKYGFMAEEINLVKKKIKYADGDAFIMVLGPDDKIERAFSVIIERLELAAKGVPPETRRAMENGNTEFLRGLHGGSRLYPDTDSRAIVVSQERVDAINTPPKPWDIIETMSKKHKLDPKRVEELILDGFLGLFTHVIGTYDINPALVLNTLLDTLTALARDGVDVDVLTDQHLLDIFGAIAKNEISKEAIDDILREIAKSPASSLKDIMTGLKISAMSVDALRSIINNLILKNASMIKEKGERAFQPLMGDVMREARGKIDGKVIAQELKAALEKALKS